MIRKHFRLKQIALGLAFAAVVVPTAQARVVIDGYAAPVSYTAVAHQPISSTIKLTGAALVNAPASRVTAAPAGVKLTGAALVNAPVPTSDTSTGGTASSSSVNWSAVGIGASVSFAALLLLLTAVALGRRNRPRDLAGV
ncbi:MAG TPA: hypothetical protein VK613_09940 [Gaiellaceae bacterium]|nr:hypothetical protein [Gaiellaceae bacterium]